MISTSNNTVSFGDSIINFSRYYKNIFNKKNRRSYSKIWIFCKHIITRNVALYKSNKEDSEFDVAMIHVGVEDTLICQSDINQFNNPAEYRKHSK